MNAIKNITVGHTERLRKPVGYTMLANLVNIVPFCLSIEAINVIFRTFDGSGTPLDTNRLWMIFAILVVYMVVMAFAERAAYRANFRGARRRGRGGHRAPRPPERSHPPRRGRARPQRRRRTGSAWLSPRKH